MSDEKLRETSRKTEAALVRYILYALIALAVALWVPRAIDDWKTAKANRRLQEILTLTKSLESITDPDEMMRVSSKIINTLREDDAERDDETKTILMQQVA